MNGRKKTRGVVEASEGHVTDESGWLSSKPLGSADSLMNSGLRKSEEVIYMDRGARSSQKTKQVYNEGMDLGLFQKLK